MGDYDDIPFWLAGDDVEAEELMEAFEEYEQRGERCFMDKGDYVSLICYCFRTKSFDLLGNVISAAEYFYENDDELTVYKAYFYVLTDEHEKAQSMLAEIDGVGDYELMITIGDVYKEMSMHESAIEWFDRVLDSDADTDLKGYVMLAMSDIYGEMGEHDRSLDYLKYIFESDSEDTVTADLLVSGFINYDKTDAGVEYFKGYVEDRCYSLIGWMSLGRIYNERRENEKAIEALDYAISIDDKFAMPYFFKGCALTDLGEVDEAIRMFNIVMEYDLNEDKNFSVFYNLARCYMIKCNFAEAMYYFKLAIESGVPEDDLSVYIECARLMMLENKMADAYEYISRAIDMEPDNMFFYVVKSEWYAKSGRIDEAISILEFVIEKDNVHYLQFLRLADMYELTENYELAMSILMDGLKSCYDVVHILYKLGAIVTIHVSDKQGLTLIEHAYDIDPTGINEMLLMYPQIEDLVRNKLDIN